MRKLKAKFNLRYSRELKLTNLQLVKRSEFKNQASQSLV